MASEPFGTRSAASNRMVDAGAGRRWVRPGPGGAGDGVGVRGWQSGPLVSWINFRWLKGSVQAFGRAATAQAGSQNVRVPVGAYIKFFARFALLLGILYVILTRSWLPVIPVLAGLFASAAGGGLGAGVRVGVERRAPKRKRLVANRPKLTDH